MNIFTSVSATQPGLRQHKFRWRGGAAARCLVSIAVASAVAAGSAYAASANFVATPADNTFATGANWNTGTAPGVNDGTTVNTDTATFNQTVTNGFGTVTNPLVIDPNRNLQNITFNAAAASAYVIGTTGGNALLLTSGGTISTTSTVANLETVNAPLVIEPASSTTAGTCTFSSNAGAPANTLLIGGAVTLGTTTAVDMLNLAGTNTGANDFSGMVSNAGTGGLIIAKSGAGSWTFGGNGTSTANQITVNNAGALSFGSATESPTLTLSGSGLTIDSSGSTAIPSPTFNMVSGTLGLGSSNGAFTMNTGTYNQTGGAVSVSGSGISYLANASSTQNSIFNLSGGTFTTASSSYFYGAVRGTSTINLSGTGVMTAPIFTLLYGSSGVSNTASDTVNLGNGTAGGTLVTNAVLANVAGASTGTGTFNFNGGTLKASASSASFMTGLTNAFIKAGGAIIDTQAFTDTIAQNLLTDTVSTGGGLTKLSAGTLILTGTNTYTGPTSIAAGLLGINSDAALGAAPASPTTNIQFTGTSTLQDTTTNVTLNANRSITIANGSTATLDSAANTFQVAGAVTIAGSGATATTLALTGSSAGAGDFSGTVSDTGSTGGLIISKTGAGTWTFGGNGTSALAKGYITLSAGTLNFGSATETPSLTASAATTGATASLYISGGTFNMNAGSLTQTIVGGGAVGLYDTGGTINVNGGAISMTAAQGLVLSGSQTYTQTGGSFSTNGRIEFANNGGSSVVNVSGGSLTTSASTGIETVRGTSTITLSGTGTITAPTLDMSTTQINSAAGTAASTFNLNGGTLVTNTIIPGTNYAAGAGGTFNFNGGTLKASASSTSFMTGITTAKVQAGGAVIDTQANNDTVAQPLVTDPALGGAPDGGLTKNGIGTLTITGANTYNGGTIVNNGIVSGDTPSYSTGNVTVNTGGTVDYTTATNRTYSPNIGGAGLVTVHAQSGNTLTYTGVDSAAGGTTVSSGTLLLNHGGGALTGPVAVATGGTVGLNNNNEIAPSSNVTLAGGTLAANSHSEGSAGAPGLGTLQVGNPTGAATNSTLDFGDATGTSFNTLAFSDSSALTWNGTVTLTNYTDGNDKLYIGQSKDLTTTQLSDIRFGGLSAGQDATGKITFAAAPEPSGWASTIIGMGVLSGIIARKRRKSAADAIMAH